MAELGFGRQLSRASQLKPVPVWVYIAGAGVGLFLALRFLR